MKYARRTVWAVVVASLLVAGRSARAQVIVGSDVAAGVQAPWNTARASTMALRAPGRVLRTARADFVTQHSRIINQSRQGPIITDQPVDQTLDQQVRISVISQLFASLNAGLALLNNAIRLNAGLPPQLPPNIGNTGTGGLNLGNTSTGGLNLGNVNTGTLNPGNLSSLLGNITAAG